MSASKSQKVSSLFTVLGGGISSLATAYNLAKHLPSAAISEKSTITIVEATDRLGGWIRSDIEQISDGLETLCEKGPRTLRLDGSRESKAMLELIDDLGLHDQVVFTPKSAPASTNRFIYYQNAMNAVPAKPSHLLTRFPPVIRPAYKAVLKDLFGSKNTPVNKTDESVSQLLERRFGKKIDDCLVSAIMGGIYGSDTEQLSARMVINRLWRAERISGKIVTGMGKAVKDIGKQLAKNSFLTEQVHAENKGWVSRYRTNRDFWNKVHSSSVLSFVDGMQTLSDAILENLKARSNVRIITQDPCVKINKPTNPDQMASVDLQSGLQIESGKVVNTVPLVKSKSFFGNGNIPSIFASSTYTSICLVNLTYKGKGVSPFEGFGFLVPRDSWEELGVIGVVFDSCCLPDQDVGNDITRFTVMMGGPTFTKQFGSSAIVDHAHITKLATDSIRKALGITADPIHTDATVLNDCIPVYGVNYFEKLADLHKWLQTWNGSLCVSGAAFGGPGVNPIILHAKDTSTKLLADFDAESLNHKYKLPFTGLDEILKLY